MSENGFGSERATPTAEQYRRRRIIAGIIAIIVLLLLVWGMVALVNAIRGSGKDSANAGAVATTTAAPFSDFSERPSESPTAVKTVTAEASESTTVEPTGEASENAKPKETVTAEPAETATAEATVTASEPATAEASATTEAAVVACTANDLKVTLTTDQQSYAAGANPALAITYTNSAGSPCNVGGDAQSIDINITSGSAQVYNSSKCQQQTQEESELAAGASNTVVMTWNRQINALGCASSTTIQPGYYWATATVNGVASTPIRIIVTG